MTVSDAYPMWMESLKVKTSQSNWRPLESRWRNRVLPAIGNKRLSSISEQALQNVVDRSYADGLSKKTLQSMCADMRAFFKFCRMSNLCDFRPEYLSVPAGARKREKKIMQPDGLMRLFQCDETAYRKRVIRDPFINAYRFQVVTGLRPGELIGLDWSDVKGDYIRIRKAINIYQEETRGKNDNAVRSIRLFPLAKKILREQYSYTGGVGSIFNIEKEKLYYSAFQRYLKFNGIPPCSLYELRHTFVSVVKVLPAGQVKAWVGHSQDMDTFGVYAHELTGDDAKTANEINAVFDKLIPSENQVF